jgi:hypothetical protein
VHQWYGPQDVFFKVRADDGNLLHPAPGDIHARWPLASGVISAAATQLNNADNPLAPFVLCHPLKK